MSVGGSSIELTGSNFLKHKKFNKEFSNLIQLILELNSNPTMVRTSNENSVYSKWRIWYNNVKKEHLDRFGRDSTELNHLREIHIIITWLTFNSYEKAMKYLSGEFLFGSRSAVETKMGHYGIRKSSGTTIWVDKYGTNVKGLLEEMKTTGVSKERITIVIASTPTIGSCIKDDDEKRKKKKKEKKRKIRERKKKKVRFNLIGVGLSENEISTLVSERGGFFAKMRNLIRNWKWLNYFTFTGFPESGPQRVRDIGQWNDALDSEEIVDFGLYLDAEKNEYVDVFGRVVDEMSHLVKILNTMNVAGLIMSESDWNPQPPPPFPTTIEPTPQQFQAMNPEERRVVRDARAVRMIWEDLTTIRTRIQNVQRDLQNLGLVHRIGTSSPRIYSDGFGKNFDQVQAELLNGPRVNRIVLPQFPRPHARPQVSREGGETTTEVRLESEQPSVEGQPNITPPLQSAQEGEERRQQGIDWDQPPQTQTDLLINPTSQRQEETRRNIQKIVLKYELDLPLWASPLGIDEETGMITHVADPSLVSTNRIYTFPGNQVVLTKRALVGEMRRVITNYHPSIWENALDFLLWRHSLVGQRGRMWLYRTYEKIAEKSPGDRNDTEKDLLEWFTTVEPGWKYQRGDVDERDFQKYQTVEVWYEPERDWYWGIILGFDAQKYMFKVKYLSADTDIFVPTGITTLIPEQKIYLKKIRGRTNEWELKTHWIPWYRKVDDTAGLRWVLRNEPEGGDPYNYPVGLITFTGETAFVNRGLLKYHNAEELVETDPEGIVEEEEEEGIVEGEELYVGFVPPVTGAGTEDQFQLDRPAEESEEGIQWDLPGDGGDESTTVESMLIGQGGLTQLVTLVGKGGKFLAKNWGSVKQAASTVNKLRKDVGLNNEEIKKLVTETKKFGTKRLEQVSRRYEVETRVLGREQALRLEIERLRRESREAEQKRLETRQFQQFPGFPQQQQQFTSGGVEQPTRQQVPFYPFPIYPPASFYYQNPPLSSLPPTPTSATTTTKEEEESETTTTLPRATRRRRVIRESGAQINRTLINKQQRIRALEQIEFNLKRILTK